MNRRRLFAAGSVTSVALLAVGIVWLGGNDARGTVDDGATGTSAPEATATVTRRDLVERTELSGTLGYGETTTVALGAQGTVTALPALGTVVDRGQTIAEVDGRPVVLLFGDRPMWRTLDETAAEGPDIAQLEANLIALGFGTESSLGPNDTWSQATTAAVQRWQASLGLEETGVVSPRDLVFLPGAVRVAGHASSVGSPATGPVLNVTTTARLVTVDLEASRQDLVQVGQAVEVELTDGSVVAAHVAALGTVAEQAESDGGVLGQESDPTVEMTVTLDDPAVGGTLDEAPVTVRVVTTSATAVLSVPVDALLALAEGGYAVERVEADGSTSLVGVELGAFADGFVEVRGDLAEGDEVVVPA